MINLTIDGVQIEAKEGQSILSAAREHGIHIPTLCFLEKINEIGSCRICVVEVEGMNKLVTACNTKVKAGMNITTDSPAVIESRKNTLHLLMAEHKTNCFKCIKNGACELQAMAREYGIGVPNFKSSHGDVQHEPFNAHPFLSYDPGLCIQCQRCISTCAKATGRHALSLERNGARVYPYASLVVTVLRHVLQVLLRLREEKIIVNGKLRKSAQPVRTVLQAVRWICT